MRTLLCAWVLLAAAIGAECGEQATGPSIPSRRRDAMSGSEFIKRVASMTPAQREAEIVAEFGRGNLPEFLRKFHPIRASMKTKAGERIEATYFVSPDYLAIGNDEDFVRMPMTPGSAQAIADAYDCVLITRKMSDDIFAQADVRLPPKPLSEDREKVESFLRHNQIIEGQRREKRARLGLLVAGTKKDVVLSARLNEHPGRVAIFGWHFSEQEKIQNLSIVHRETYVDYSHGIRLASRAIVVGDKGLKIEEIWGDPERCALLSDEGPIDALGYVSSRKVGNKFP